MRELDHGNFGEPEFLPRSHATVSRDHAVFSVHEDGISPSEFVDRYSDLRNLRLRVRARVALVRDQIRDRAILNNQVILRRFYALPWLQKLALRAVAPCRKGSPGTYA